MSSQFNTLFAEWQQWEGARKKLKERIFQKFMLEFNYNSNHIEGNTLTYGQTELLLLFGKVIGDALMRDLEEMKAHNVGLKMVIEEALIKEKQLTETFIRQVHKILLREDYDVHRQLPNGLVSSYTVHAGCYKTRPNSVITRTGERFEYASPEETPALMTDLLTWYNCEAEKGHLSPVELATLFHYRYIRIHPFEDGNGRIARLMVNFILARNGYPMVVVPSKKKEEYLTAFNKCDIAVGSIPADGAHAGLEQVRPFVEYFEQLAESEMRNDIAIVKGGNTPQWWYNGEIVKFKNDNVNKILDTIITAPKTSVRELAQVVGINKSAIQRHLKSLQGQGYIVRVGSSTRGGEWHVALTRL
ncbi:MAG: Fic family protein [Bacteroidales bacterium]|nr:Fic family protein [Bacteroidales bacterium]